MKKLLLSAAFFFAVLRCFAQSSEMNSAAMDLVRQGIFFHDQGDYETAIDYYEDALVISPDEAVIYYEIAFSYLYAENPKKALEYAEEGIALAEAQEFDELLPALYDLKASALDNLDRREEAVEVFLMAIDKFGTSNTLLYYNLALTYYRMDNLDSARETVMQAIIINPLHASGNFLMGKICYEQNRKTQAFYSLCYFLLLEPQTARSAEAYETVKRLMSKEGQGGGIGISNTGTFMAADILLSLVYSLDETPENRGKNESELFAAKLASMFEALGDLANREDNKIERTEGDELWWDYYAPFFRLLVESEHFETYCHYISMSIDSESDEWLQGNPEKVNAFFSWLNGE
jgi:tetratricopeptide (TPR) repeat protein